MQLERSEDCMEKFLGALQKIAQEMHQRKQSNRFYSDTLPERPQEAQFHTLETWKATKLLTTAVYSGKFTVKLTSTERPLTSFL